MWEIFNRNLDQSKDEQNIYILDHGIDFCSVGIGYKPNTGPGLSIRGDTRRNCSKYTIQFETSKIINKCD